ncbi:APC family permease [Anaerorhabdus sp.]|uniref:APC family permease n=1 Tax=Anaerorhabdus sp. TaxID=1872524 RepID=UPI002B217736|nr:APC family permease [Anaerorhabdus sp.]MEA4875417.1 APC family permease [Anaerorhabdus sp.]
MTTNDTSMKKTLTIWNFFTIGFGAIIGTGWVLQVGDWMDKGGGPVAAIIAFILGAIFLLPVGAVFGELTSAIPISGGIVEYVDRTFGKKLSFVTGWFLSLGNGILCPWEAIAISKLVGMLIPQLKIIPLYTIMGYTVYLPPLLISLAFAFYVIRLNFKGASSAAKLQGFLTKMLLAGMLIAMVVSVFTGGPHHLQPIVSESNGNSLIMGIIPVLVMTPFFYAGFDTIPQQAEEAAEGLDWKKFGQVISLALLAAGIFYACCIYAFGTIVPWNDFVSLGADGSVPALAVLKSINGIFFVVMMCIAILGPLGPMNSFFGATSRILLAMGRKKQLPASFEKLDENGNPKTANYLMAALTLIGPFLGGNMLIPLTNVSALAFIFACFMCSAACLKMRFSEPELKRPYSVPGGKFGISLACLACLCIIALMVLPFSPAALVPVEWSIVIGWLVVGLIFNFVSGKSKTVIEVEEA